MIRAKELRAALARLNLRKIQDATLNVHLVSVQAWGPQFDGTLTIARNMPDGTRDLWEDRPQIDLGRCAVRNGYTDEGRRFVRRGEEGASYDRWEHYIDSHASTAIYLPESATVRLNRCQIMSLYACAAACDTLQFQLWFDAGTSPAMIEQFVHGDVLSVMCEHDRGRRTPSWEHTIETWTGRHNVARAGAAVNRWPSVRRTMDALGRAIDHGKRGEGLYDRLLAGES